MPVPPPVIKAVRPLSVSLVNIRIFPIVASALVDDAQALCHPARQAWPGANAARVSLARTGLLSSKTHCLAHRPPSNTPCNPVSPPPPVLPAPRGAGRRAAGPRARVSLLSTPLPPPAAAGRDKPQRAGLAQA